MWFPRTEAPDSAALKPIAFMSKSLITTETCYSNKETETFGILDSLENIHHYCFGHEVRVITDHKPVVASFNKYVASLSHWLQRIFLYIHQDNIGTMYKPEPPLFTADWLSRHNHET